MSSTRPIRILIDGTDTFRNRGGTGIQRVVRGFSSNAAWAAQRVGLEAKVVVFQGEHFAAVPAIPPPPVNSKLRVLRVRLNTLYWAVTHAVLQRWPSPCLKRILTPPRSKPGLARLLFWPVALVSSLISAIRRAGTEPLQVVAMGPRDVLFLPDASWTADWDAIARARQKGVKIATFVHDIIPITHPEFFESDHIQRFAGWIERVFCTSDVIVCNSKFTRDSVLHYCDVQGISPPSHCAVVPLGCEIEAPLAKSKVSHTRLRRVLNTYEPVFVCVGTIEPRKNHSRLLDAMDQRWSDGSLSVLLLIGKRGWLCNEILTRVCSHPEYKRKLFWFDDVDDKSLVAVYSSASALVFPSLVEGFGLPLVEALSLGLRPLVSDIPAFREIAGESAVYFDPHDASSIASALATVEMNRLPRGGRQTRVHFSWPSWLDSTHLLFNELKRLVGGTGSRPAEDLPSFPHEAVHQGQ